ncbi:hypothetical protein Pint_25668 [Pistacia integerrima]|uniref:Uncharacterized protein n=1 Tax=Pistacia integerrima TaxID=434235 RepID=A0ACC0YFZ8_9ROSI|nr:hypothetical protein Pint_25668 [Pistacia integerrima]
MNIHKTGQLKEALKLIISTPASHFDPSVYMPLLQFCVESKAENHAHLIHTHIITNGFDFSLNLSNKLIIFYGKVGDMVSARNVFDRMRDRNVVSWTAIISGYTQSGFYEDALLVFKGMCRGGVRANQFTFGSALRACIGMGRLSSGMQIQGCVEKGRFGESLFVKSALLDLHAKCGRIEDAWLLFKTMKERDVVSWNAMIGGFSFQGFVDDSLRLFRSMMREGHVPDCFTLGSVIRASIGGIGLMNVTQIHGLIVKLSSGSSNILIGSLIDAYAKCGNLRSAYQLYKNLFSGLFLVDVLLGVWQQYCTETNSGNHFRGLLKTDISAGRTARNLFSGVASLQILILLNFLDTDFDLISSMDKLEDPRVGLSDPYFTLRIVLCAASGLLDPGVLHAHCACLETDLTLSIFVREIKFQSWEHL